MVAKVLLYEQAEQCRRLARSIYDAHTSDELERYARQLVEQALRLEEAERGKENGAWRNGKNGAAHGDDSNKASGEFAGHADGHDSWQGLEQP